MPIEGRRSVKGKNEHRAIEAAGGHIEAARDLNGRQTDREGESTNTNSAVPPPPEGAYLPIADDAEVMGGVGVCGDVHVVEGFGGWAGIDGAGW